MFAKNPIILFALNFSFNDKQIKNPYALSLYLFQIRASNYAAEGCFILIIQIILNLFSLQLFYPHPSQPLKAF